MKVEQQTVIEGWESEIQNEFWKSLRKKRIKLDFVLKTVNQLNSSGEQKTALNLLTHFVEDYQKNKEVILEKEKYPILYKSSILNFCVRASKIAVAMNDFLLAEQFFKRGEAIYLEKESNEELKPNSAWDGYLDWARFYMDSGKSGQALGILNKFENCHTNHGYLGKFMWMHIELARLTNDFSESDRVCRELRKRNDQLSYEDLENQDYRDSLEVISKDPSMAAEAIIVYHHIDCEEIYNKNKQSLEKLEILFTENAEYAIDSYQEEFLNNKLIPELGAYLGEVLVQTFNGKWIESEKLMKCRIQINEHIINPFLYAFEVVHYGHRLVEDFYNIIDKKISA